MTAPTPKQCPKCGARFDRMALFCQKDGTALVNPNAPPDPYVGRVLLDQFRIEERVGQGGMGTVYRARQTTIGRDVAIKILHPELTHDSDAVRRFQREARVSAALDHPNVVRVFLFGQLPEDGSLYLVMQYLEGRSLLELTAEAPLPPSRALHVATQICDGIGEAHLQGVIHRDVKPENIMLVQRGQDPDFVKVLDFGIARFVTGEQTVATQSGLIFGTARYISPEGAEGEPTDARSDVYSVGVLLYQMLTGHTPFESTSPVALLMMHINDAAPDIRGHRGGSALPANVCDVVMRCLAKNPDARYDDANELSVALRGAAMADGVAVAPPRLSAMPVQASQPRRDEAVVPRGYAPSSPGPTGPTGPMGPDAVAPTPFVYSGETEVPGLRGGRLRKASTFIGALIVGALLVILGALAWQPIIAFVAGGPDLEALEAQAWAAMTEGRYQSPRGASVMDITERMLTEEPGHAGALLVRDEVARKLRILGDVERGQGHPGAAEEAYRQALVFVPDDSAALAALAELEAERLAAASPPVEPSIRTVPFEPRVGEQAMVFVELAEELAEGAEPQLELTRINARGVDLDPRPDGDRRHFVASYTFRRTGTYRLSFTVGDVALSHEFEVARRAVATRDEPPVTVQHNTRVQNPVVPTMVSDNGINWGVQRPAPTPTPTPTPRAEEPQTPPPSMAPAAPAPWSSQSI